MLTNAMNKTFLDMWFALCQYFCRIMFDKSCFCLKQISVTPISVSQVIEPDIEKAASEWISDAVQTDGWNAAIAYVYLEMQIGISAFSSHLKEFTLFLI